MKKVEIVFKNKNTSVTFVTKNKRVIKESPKTWLNQKINEVIKNYDSIPSKVKNPKTIKGILTQEYYSNILKTSNNKDLAKEMTINAIEVVNIKK